MLKLKAGAEKGEAVGVADHASANGFKRSTSLDEIVAQALARGKWDVKAMFEEAQRALESLKSAPTIRCGVCGRQESTASQAFFLNGQPACSSCFADAHKEWLRERRRLLKQAGG